MLLRADSRERTVTENAGAGHSALFPDVNARLDIFDVDFHLCLGLLQFAESFENFFESLVIFVREFSLSLASFRGLGGSAPSTGVLRYTTYRGRFTLSLSQSEARYLAYAISIPPGGSTPISPKSNCCQLLPESGIIRVSKEPLRVPKGHWKIQ